MAILRFPKNRDHYMEPEAEGELDLQPIGCSQTIRVEVFGPFGLHQDREKRLWCITHLRSRRPIGLDWSIREMATIFIDGLRTLPILWDVETPNFQPFINQIRQMRAALAGFATMAEAEARGEVATPAAVDQAMKHAIVRRAIRDAQLEARTRAALWRRFKEVGAAQRVH
jgi:hypothetical protein